MDLKEMREEIGEEREWVDIKPYSHNIISMNLRFISEKYGREEANKAVRDFNLKPLGWNEVEE